MSGCGPADWSHHPKNHVWIAVPVQQSATPSAWRLNTETGALEFCVVEAKPTCTEMPGPPPSNAPSHPAGKVFHYDAQGNLIRSNRIIDFNDLKK
jgi:hypothetical protein